MAAVKYFDVDQYADWQASLVWMNPTLGTVSITAAGNLLTVSAAETLVVGNPIYLGAMTGTSGLVEGTVYYVASAPSPTTLTLSATPGGAVITIAGAGTSASISTPINITGYTALMEWRVSALATPVLTLAVGTGITLTGATGTIAIHATASQMGAITAGVYQYDLLLTSGAGIATRLVQGNINLSQGISHV